MMTISFSFLLCCLVLSQVGVVDSSAPKGAVSLEEKKDERSRSMKEKSRKTYVDEAKRARRQRQLYCNHHQVT